MDIPRIEDKTGGGLLPSGALLLTAKPARRVPFHVPFNPRTWQNKLDTPQCTALDCSPGVWLELQQRVPPRFPPGGEPETGDPLRRIRGFEALELRLRGLGCDDRLALKGLDKDAAVVSVETTSPAAWENGRVSHKKT